MRTVRDVMRSDVEVLRHDRVGGRCGVLPGRVHGEESVPLCLADGSLGRDRRAAVTSWPR